MFKEEVCITTRPIWFKKASVVAGTPVLIRWGIRWAHFYHNGKKLGKILKPVAKEKVEKWEYKNVTN